MTTRTMHLGVSGEEAAEDLMAAFSLGSGFQAAAVTSPHDEVLTELRRRFSETTHVVEIRPGGGWVDDLLSMTNMTRRKRLVAWLQDKGADYRAWRRVLIELNQKREWLRSRPLFLVVAGSRDVAYLAQQVAPDFWSIVTPVRHFSEEPSAAIETTHTLRWLHISDTHFREDELWDRRATLRALIAKVRELNEKELAPDLVFVTGDIGWSGKPKEYEQATRFFHELNKVLELDPKDRWFLVPGNHDIDRSRITRSHRAIQAGLTDEASVEETLHDPDAMRLLSTRLEAYYAFAADFLGAARALQPDHPWRTDVREFGGISVGILQLNSAWIAEGGKADEANLLIGEAQLREALDSTPDAFFRIALMHHPLRNLRDFDANRVESLLAANGGAAFLLRGHLHLNRTKLQLLPDGNLLEIASGTLYSSETNWPRGFHLGEIDLEKGEARVHLFRYSGEGGGFFAPDNLTYENARDGIFKIRLPAGYRLGSKKPKAADTTSEHQRLSLIARYRAAAAAYHGHARFIGFPNQAPRPNVRVSDLFVPLRMKSRGEKAETHSLSTAAIAQRLLGPPQHSSARIVVLGDPGSGKTTLSRFLVMLAAGAITMTDVEVIGEPLPLRIAFRDFIERQRENPNLSLLDYLALQAKNELSLALPRNFLRKAIDDGQAILLLDGLDEVGAPEHRAAARDLVAAFAAAHSKVPMLVTSRIVGYDDAPLSGQTVEVKNRHVLVAFYQLVLEKFDDDDLRSFVDHWYSVQEPTDPMARDRGVADLLAALNADERVRELARTPILATLIAMIHRVEANLPGERAKLYELCVRMLLETWPAQAKRPFTEIDPSLQRAFLASLAFEMQLGRTSYSRETVTITRNDIKSKLIPILRKRDFARQPLENIVGVIERWIDHLEKESGILVEQSSGVYGFFHLSIMEYLAALGMEREFGRDGTVTAIAEHFDEAPWQEVCLLAVGSHAEDGDFLDAVYKWVGDSKKIQRWDFLMRCLQEEARFRPEQVEVVLDSYAATLLKYDIWSTDLRVTYQIRHFSVRHGTTVQRWIENRLDHSSGRELVATAAFAMAADYHGILDRLANRRDSSAAAGPLLEFWPGSELGVWASGNADSAAALSWSRRTPLDVAHLRAIAAIRLSSEPLASATLMVLNERSVRSCVEALENIARLAKLSRPGGRGLPTHVNITQREGALLTGARTPVELGTRTNDARSRFARGFSGEFISSFVYDFADDFADGVTNRFSSDFIERFASAFADDFARTFISEFAGYLVRDFARYFVKDFVSNLVRDFRLPFAGVSPPTVDIDLDFTDSPRILCRSLMLSLRASNGEEEARRARSELLAAMTDEAWIALATTVMSESHQERIGYLSFRLQNRWLFEVWAGIDQRLPENPSPAQLALYFALGWAQSTTTWAWPDSERWRTLFAAGPGEHWLVRSQWHLCKLTDDPASKDDDAGLRAALRDGHGDESLPGYAARLSEVLGIEG